MVTCRTEGRGDGVIGIEADGELDSAARANLEEYCGEEGGYRFIAGDVFEVLAQERVETDVVLCLGFLHHTVRYTELFKRIREIGPRHLVLDSRVVPRTDQARVFLTRDRIDRQANAKQDSFSYGGRSVVGIPSVPALEFFSTPTTSSSNASRTGRPDPRQPVVRSGRICERTSYHRQVLLADLSGQRSGGPLRTRPLTRAWLPEGRHP